MRRWMGVGVLLAGLVWVHARAAWAQTTPPPEAPTHDDLPDTPSTDGPPDRPTSDDPPGTPADHDPLTWGDRPPFDQYDEGGFGYVFGGVLGLGLDDLNDALLIHGYGTISEIFITMGTGAFVSAQRFLVGLETYQTLGNEGDRQADNRVALDGTFWLGHLAYLFNLGPIHLYPILGIGFGTWTLGLVEGRPDFNDAVGGRPAHAELEFNSFLLQFAFGVQYLIALSSSAEEVSGILVGARLGYSLSPLDSTWQLSGVGLDPAPDMSIRAPYLCLVLGYGSWSASEGVALPLIGD